MKVWANSAGVCQPRREWGFGVVVVAPGSQRDAGMMQERKQGLVQQLISQTTVEAFNDGIPGQLTPLAVYRQTARGQRGAM